VVKEAHRVGVEGGEPHAGRGEPHAPDVVNEGDQSTPRSTSKRAPEKRDPSHELEGAVGEVFEYWRTQRATAVGKDSGPPMQPTRKRLSRIRGRIGEGYTVDELKEAIDGCLSNQWNVDGGYTDIERICRDQDHVEQYKAWARNGPPGRTSNTRGNKRSHAPRPQLQIGDPDSHFPEELEDE
jgi:hypothetical protein